MLWNFILFAVAGAALYGLFLLTCRFAGFIRSHRRRSPGMSLLLVVRNQAAVIEGVIRGILAYHHRPLPFFELVVVDDCSDDETPQILTRLNRRHHFELIQMKQFPGAKPQDVGIGFCRGEVVYCIGLTDEIDLHLFLKVVGSKLGCERVSPAEAGRWVILIDKRVAQV